MSSKRLYSILLLSLLFAITAFAVLLWKFPVSHSTVALILVKDRPAHTLFPDLHQKPTPEEIERFQKTQMKMLTSEFVLQSALSRNDIAQLQAVVEKESKPVEWLQNELQVSFPDGGEVLELRYEGPQDTKEMKRILSAIIAVFQQDVIGHKRIKHEEQRENIARVSSALSKELKKKLDNYYALSEELSFNLTGKGKSFYVATEEELDEVTSSLQEFVFAMEDGKVDAAQKLIDTIPKTWHEATEPPMPQTIPDAELAMLREEIEQLKQISNGVSMRQRKWRMESQGAGELFRVLQLPFSTENTRNAAESFGIAALGGVGTFVISSLGLAVLVPLFIRLTNL